MPKNMAFKFCPRCGSRNLHVEEEEGKDRFVVVCEDCDEVYEMHNKGVKELRTPKGMDLIKVDYDRDDGGFRKKGQKNQRRGKSW